MLAKIPILLALGLPSLVAALQALPVAPEPETAQQTAPVTNPPPTEAAPPSQVPGNATSQAAPSVPSESSIDLEYRLGADDEVVIRAFNVEEIGPLPFRIDAAGEINVPLIGRIRVAGLTPRELEQEVVRRLKTYLLEPQVTVSVAQFRSQPVSVLGAVNKPGVNQIEAGKTLFEVISLAGGLRPEAGNTIKITRRKAFGDIPLPSAKPDSTGAFSVAQVSVKSIMEAQNPAENIVIRPFDVVSVPRAEVVYVIGSVRKPGGFVLGERERLSVLQAIALAEGLDKAAAPKKARVLRSVQASADRTEMAVDVKAILNGKTSDVTLGPNDILFVPSATGIKGAALRSAEIAASVAAYSLVYRR